MGIQVLNETDFNEFISNASKPVIVDFYADWCGPCKMMAPILDEVQNEYAEEMTIVKVNVDESQRLAEKYSIVSIPCFVSFVNGEVHKRLVGANPKPQIVDLAQ